MTSYAKLVRDLSTKFQAVDGLRALNSADETKIERLRKKIETRNRRMNAIRPHWVNEVARPLGEALRAEGGFALVSVLGPCGIGARVSIDLLPEGVPGDYFERTPEQKAQCLCFTVTRDSETNGLAIVDYRTQVREYPPNSVGDVNGLGYAEVPIPVESSLGEILELVRSMRQAEAEPEPAQAES